MCIFPSSVNMPRPIRLSEETRRFAYDSLHHAYGKDTRKTPVVCVDDIPDFAVLSTLDRYDACIRAIAENSPIRIVPGERISGAATLGAAIDHVVPVTHEGKIVFAGISHLTVDFETVLARGTNGIRADIRASLEKHTDEKKRRFLKSCDAMLDCMELWHARYLEALAAHDRPEVAEHLKRVPMEPPTCFAEAVQSLWFTFAFLRLCGCWPGIGRIDLLLGRFLSADLASGRLTQDEAREILAHFFIKGCEWITGENRGSGDAQHYQNILLGGLDENEREITNEVSYLVLDILEELGISDFPTTVRVNENTDERFLRRICEVMRYGGGMLAFYNEDLILRALEQDGYERAEALKFANDGCWEVQIPGKTYFMYSPFDGYALLQKNTLKNYENAPDFADFESLYRAYLTDLTVAVDGIGNWLTATGHYLENGEWVANEQTPCTVVSIFEDGCIEKGRSYWEAGPVYNVYSPHFGGLADTVNALRAIDQLVFREKRCTFSELMDILRRNWEGEEALRLYARNGISYYGNDDDAADSIAVRLLADFSAMCAKQYGKSVYRVPGGVSTFGRQIEWAPHRLASPHGRKQGEVLAANCSPTPGTDQMGATASIRSYCKADLSRLVSGAALDLKLLPSSVKGEDGLDAMVALVRGFVALGGFFMQPDVADASVLRAAQEHPEDYQTLSVRVSGWNARFVTLNREWQDMVITEVES